MSQAQRVARSAARAAAPKGKRSAASETAVECDVVIPYDPVNLRWVAASVESILNQTGVRCLVHLVADGFEKGDDPALRFLHHPQVRLYRNDSVIGPYRTVNRLAGKLKAPFLALQDSDDIALPHRLRFSIDALELAEAEIFAAAMQQFVSYDARDQRSLKRLAHAPVLVSGDRGWNLCPEGFLVNGTLVMRAETFKRLNGFAPVMASGDMEFATRARRAGCRVVTEPSGGRTQRLIAVWQ